MVWVILFANISQEVDVRAAEIYNRSVDMLFVENVGQISGDVVYYTMHPSVVYVLRDGTIYINGARITFHSSPKRIAGIMPLMTRISYFGRNRDVSNIPTYRRVVLEDIYPNIDAVLTADGRGVVEIQFLVHPGGDPSRIIIETDVYLKEESDGIYLVKEGKEVAKLTQLKGYQGAEEVYVEADVNGKELRFQVDGWDGRHTLVIDPIVAAIMASSGMELIYSIIMDSLGDVFLIGYTNHSDDFASNRIMFGIPGNNDAFITKLSVDLSTHIATAVLASDGDDWGVDAAVDSSGNVFVAGFTSNFSSFAPERTVLGNPGFFDIFITKLRNDLSTHIATVILGSSGYDEVADIILDGRGNVFICGRTGNSSDFAPDRAIFGTPGSGDAFITILSNDLSTHVMTAILTSSENDEAYSMVITSFGNILITGRTSNYSDFAPDRIVFGTPAGIDVFVTKLSSDLSFHISTAILGSSGNDLVDVLLLDNSGNIIVSGDTDNSEDFVSDGVVFGALGGSDVFIIRMSGDLSTLIATAVLSSSGNDLIYDMDIDSYGNILLVGETESSNDFAPDRNIIGIAGASDAFVSKISGDLSAHIASVILGSRDNDIAFSVAVDNSNDVYVAGYTGNYTDFLQEVSIFGTPGGLMDAYVARLPQSLNSFEKPRGEERNRIAFHGGVLKVNLGESAYVGVDIYDLSGRLLKRMTYGYLPAGQYQYRLNLAKGTYILRVRIGEKIKSLKIVM